MLSSSVDHPKTKNIELKKTTRNQTMNIKNKKAEGKKQSMDRWTTNTINNITYFRALISALESSTKNALGCHLGMNSQNLQFKVNHQGWMSFCWTREVMAYATGTPL
jgi:hypothetical protein